MQKKPNAIEKKILKLENKIMKQKATLAKLRRRVPLKHVEDYLLTTTQGRLVKISQLIGKKDELILIHNMGTSCPYCTMWADGFNGELHHIENRAAFVVETPNAPSVQRKFA